MKLIVLSGESHCGKTTILKRLCQRLGEQCAEIAREVPAWSDNDIECVFQCGERRVAVCTMGDYNCVIKTYGQKYADCDVLICALNSGFMRNTKYKPFEDVLAFDPRTTVVLKRREPDETHHESADRACTEQLLRLLSVI